jgi:ketosteroid isomerase-like protein
MDEIVAWLREWQALINSGDLETAKPLFSDDVIAYGSLTPVMTGRADLMERQWSSMWPRIKDFAFSEDTIHILADEGMRVVTVATLWRSLGLRRDGSTYERRGRATLVLRREGQRYLCVHSHFSMEPGIPPVDG